MYKKIFLNPVVLFLFNALFLLSLVKAADHYILTKDFYLTALGDSELLLNPGLLNIDERLKALTYTATILLMFLKYNLVALLLYTGCYLKGVKVSYKAVFRIVALSEMILLLPALIKVIWFAGFPPASLLEWQQFYPLSLLSLTGRLMPPVAVYPLQLLNVFELFYVLSLGFLLAKVLPKKNDHALEIICLSYLPALLVWTLMVSYYTLILLPQ